MVMTAQTGKSPAVLLSNTFPKKDPVYELRLRCKAGEIFLSKSLVNFLTFGDDVPRVALLNINNRQYITRSDDPEAFAVYYKRDDKRDEIAGGVVTNIGVTRFLRQLWNVDVDQIATVQVMTNYSVPPAEIGQDPTHFPYPIYRLATDLISKK